MVSPTGTDRWKTPIDRWFAVDGTRRAASVSSANSQRSIWTRFRGQGQHRPNSPQEPQAPGPGARALGPPTSGDAGAPRRNGLSPWLPVPNQGDCEPCAGNPGSGGSPQNSASPPKAFPRVPAAKMGSEPDRVPVNSPPQATPQPRTPQRKKSDFLLGEHHRARHSVEVF